MRKIKTKEVINHETGEVIVTQSEYSTDKEPTYFKSYIEDIGAVYKLSKPCVMIFHIICCEMDYKNVIEASSRLRDIVLERTGLGYDSFHKSINTLYKKEFLLRVEGKNKNYYIVNAKYAGKGNYRDIKKIKMSIEYTKNGKYCVTQFEKGDE